jgi:hypothetical protein
MRTKVFEVPNKLLCEWDSEAKVMIDTWTTYGVTLDEFKEAVFVKGVNYAKANGVKAWIVDSHKATGIFTPEIQKFIETDVFPKFASIGVKFFMTINSDNAATKMTVAQYSAKVGPNGMKVLNGSNAEDAIKWISKNT